MIRVVSAFPSFPVPNPSNRLKLRPEMTIRSPGIWLAFPRASLGSRLSMKVMFRYFLFLLFSLSAFAQPFRNLGFEEAVTNITEAVEPFRPGVGYGPISDLLPGWQVRLESSRTGTNNVERIGLNVRLGTDIVSLYQAGPEDPFEGDYFFGTVAVDWPEPRYSLLQRGDLPVNAYQIYFRRNGDPVQLSINGTMLPLVEFSAVPGRPIAGLPGLADVFADVTAFAGQNVELKLTHQVGILLWTQLDSIQIILPEPSTYALMGLGGFVLLIRVMRRRKLLRC
jgi:hypothetical protein